MAAAYERKYGHPPSQADAVADGPAGGGDDPPAEGRRPRKIHGQTGRQDADRGGTAGRVGGADRGRGDDRAVPGAPDVAAFGRARRARRDDAAKRMAARVAVAEVQQHHAVWSLAELRFEVDRALPPGGSTAGAGPPGRHLAAAPGSGTGVLLVTAPEVTDVIGLGRAGTGRASTGRRTRPGTPPRAGRPRGAHPRGRQTQVPQRVSRGHGPPGADRTGLNRSRRTPRSGC